MDKRVLRERMRRKKRQMMIRHYTKIGLCVIGMILAVVFFVKLSSAYFDYRKHGQFDFTAPAILFACLVFTLTAPLYIWKVLGI